MKLQKSTFQLLRLPFSFFLMPVYWFALGQVVYKDVWSAVLIFFILHILVYPASNGYNSYMDRDTSPIGGLEHPLLPTRQLFLLTVGMDVLALILGCWISLYFVAGLAGYILASRAYSYRGIRLKKYPIAGYLTVIICQGALIFFLVYHGSHPLTQLYQHEEDRKDGVRTISLLLGTEAVLSSQELFTAWLLRCWRITLFLTCR
ncbi:MAG: UbiA family prenyltransferase [Bacteroidota bacterium]